MLKLNPNQAAEIIGLDRPDSSPAARTRFWAAVHTNAIPHYAIGRRTIVFDERELRLWMQSRRRGQHVELPAKEAA